MLGHRIGYGAGHYDYTFAHLRKAKPVIGIGVAFAAQEIKAVPALFARRGARLCANGSARRSISGAPDLRILFVGDVVGRTGRTAITEHLPGMIRDWSLDLVIVNGENSAGGFGITEAIYGEFARCRRGCDHARQSCLESEGGAGLHRARARLIRP